MAEVKGVLSLVTTKFEEGLRSAGKSLQSFSTGQLGGLKGQLAAAFTVGAITHLAQQAVEFGGKMDDLSKRTGVSAEALQKLDFAAKQNGSSIEAVAGGFQKLSVNMASALDGNKEAISHFEKLGISIEDLKSKSADQIFNQIADAVKNSTDPTETMANVVGVLGKGAGELYPLLQEGSEGLRVLGDEAAASGNVISEGMIKQLDDLGDRLEKSKGLLMQVGAQVAVFAGDLAIKGVQAIQRFAGALGTLSAVASGSISEEEAQKIVEQGVTQKLGSGPGATKPNKPRVFEREAREAKDTAGESKAARIASLKEGVAKEQHDQELESMSLAERRVALEEDIARLSDESNASDDEETKLKKSKEILDIRKQIASVDKQEQQDQNEVVKRFGEQVHANIEDQARIDELKTGKGISVSGPITDSLARIGGFVGGQADSKSRMVEKQTKLQEEMVKELKEINKRREAAGQDDFVSSST